MARVRYPDFRDNDPQLGAKLRDLVRILEAPEIEREVPNAVSPIAAVDSGTAGWSLPHHVKTVRADSTDGDITVLLPPSVDHYRREVVVHNVGTNNVLLTPYGDDTINGDTVLRLRPDHAALLTFDGDTRVLALVGPGDGVVDIIGAALYDSATIDFTYTPATPSITAAVIADSIDNTYLANMATNTIKARVTAGLGNPEDVAIAANQFLARSSASQLEAKSVTDYALSLLDDVNAAAARATLDVYSTSESDSRYVNVSGDTVTGDLTVNGNVIVGGDLTVNGTATYLNTDTLAVEDPLIALATNNVADITDIGFYGKYVATGTKYGGLFRDATDGKYRLFTGLTVAPTTTVDTGGAGYTVGTLVTSLESSSAVITGGTITGITDLAVADGGTGASTAAGARTNLGATTVGSSFFTLANPSAITFPRINADNTVTAESAATHRTSLGLAIGTNVQAWDANLDQIAALAVTDGNFIVGNGSAWVAESGATARASLGVSATGADTTYAFRANNLSDLTNAATARTNLGLVAGGAGDIWVEKAGDTMTGMLTISGVIGSAIINSGLTTNPGSIRFVSTGADAYFGVEGSVGGAFFTGAGAYSTVIYSNNPVDTIIGGVLRTRVNGVGDFSVDTDTLYVDAVNDQVFINASADPFAAGQVHLYVNSNATQTQANFLLSGTSAASFKRATSAAVDKKIWQEVVTTAGTWALRTLTDAGGAGKDAISIVRGTTTAISSISLGNATDNVKVGVNTASPQGLLHAELAARATTFDASNGATWHDLIIRNPNDTAASAVGIAFELSSAGYHTNAGIGIAAVKAAGTDYGADLAFITRPQAAVAAERMRITSGGRLLVGTTTEVANSDVPLQLNAAAATRRWIGVNAGGALGLLLGYDMVSGLAEVRNFANSPLAFRTNDTERARFTSGGNVLIGTTTDPGGKLAVDLNSSGAGVNQFAGTLASGSALAVGAMGGGVGVYWGSGFKFVGLRVVHGGSNNEAGVAVQCLTGAATFEAMRVTNAGKMLFGTTSAATGAPFLDVVGDSSNGRVGFADNTTDATNKIVNLGLRHYTNAEEMFGLIRAQSTAAANTLSLGGGSGVMNAATLITFHTAATTTTLTGTERARITSGGNVLIGSTSAIAAERLAVVSTAADTYSLHQQSGGITAIYGADGTGAYAGSYTNQAFVLRTNNTERARITSAGVVLVGTTTDTAGLFQVAGAVRVAGGYGTNYGGTANGLMLGGGGAGANAGSLSFGDNTGWQFHIGTNVGGTFTPRVTFVDTGAVQIGGNTVWHAGNDGAGSGLDADLLDGQSGAYYTSMANITGTKAQFNTACTDGDFLFVGDVAAYTDEQAQDAVGTILVDSATIDFTYNDATPSITASIIADSVSNTLLANMATSTVKARLTAGTGDPEDVAMTAANTASTIVLRDASARFQAADPSAAQDVVTKAYLQSNAPQIIAGGSISATEANNAWAIPSGTWKRLELHIVGLEAATDYVAYLRINGSTAASYNYGVRTSQSGSEAFYDASGATAMVLGKNNGLVDDNATTQNPSDLVIAVENPNGASDHKNLTLGPAYYREAGGARIAVNFGVCRWTSTAAITSLDLLLRNTTGTSPTGSAVSPAAGTYYWVAYK